MNKVIGVYSNTKEERRVLLEATRKEKEFQLVEVCTFTTRTVKRGRYSPAVQSTKKTISYEFNWRNIGASRWGRTQIVNDNKRKVSHLGAFKIFFKALDYSEYMTFRELPVFLKEEENELQH